ncbi:22982_t:CDS:2, partial [Dentiscutata erythropus]
MDTKANMSSSATSIQKKIRTSDISLNSSQTKFNLRTPKVLEQSLKVLEQFKQSISGPPNISEQSKKSVSNSPKVRPPFNIELFERTLSPFPEVVIPHSPSDFS